LNSTTSPSHSMHSRLSRDTTSCSWEHSIRAPAVLRASHTLDPSHGPLTTRLPAQAGRCAARAQALAQGPHRPQRRRAQLRPQRRRAQRRSQRPRRPRPQHRRPRHRLLRLRRRREIAQAGVSLRLIASTIHIAAAAVAADHHRRLLHLLPRRRRPREPAMISAISVRMSPSTPPSAAAATCAERGSVQLHLRCAGTAEH
jgi:hypothetical protein